MTLPPVSPPSSTTATTGPASATSSETTGQPQPQPQPPQPLRSDPDQHRQCTQWKGNILQSSTSVVDGLVDIMISLFLLACVHDHYPPPPHPPLITHHPNNTTRTDSIMKFMLHNMQKIQCPMQAGHYVCKPCVEPVGGHFSLDEGVSHYFRGVVGWSHFLSRCDVMGWDGDDRARTGGTLRESSGNGRPNGRDHDPRDHSCL